MLTADLVHVRRRGDRLTVVPLGELERQRALELGAAYIGLAQAHLGQTRGTLFEALRQVPASARETRLARGLAKLVLDRCAFDEEPPVDAPALRRDLFTRATALRRAGTFDRDQLMAEVGRAHDLTPEVLGAALYADLPEAQRLKAFEALTAETLLSVYDAAQVQAVLLRAVKLVATVRSASPATLRTLFRKLKFLRLLHRIERQGDDGCRIEIDGPFSLFEQVTKYGLQLALAFPVLTACDEWRLQAELRWGKERTPLRFEQAGRRAQGPTSSDGRLPDEVHGLYQSLLALDGPWRPAISQAVLDLPGVGLCVPDLELVHARTRQTVYVEALGFWSRDAVWKRVELAERGLPHPIVFVVSKHLRVSEAALDQEVPAALYVFARTPSARAVLERVERVAARAPSQV